MVAQRQAMLHRIRLVELLVHTALCIAAPKAWACQAPEHSPCEINKCYMYFGISDFGISARAQKQKFSILVFLTGSMGSGVFLIFQRNLVGGFSYRWFFLLVSVCCMQEHDTVRHTACALHSCGSDDEQLW